MKVTVQFEASTPDELLRLNAFAASEFSTAQPTPAPVAETPALAITSPFAAAMDAVTDPVPYVPAIAPTHDLTDLDADGFPWDIRIHQVSKGKTAKNKWKVLKNLNKNHPGLRDQVEAELKAAYPVSAAISLPPPGAVTPPPAPEGTALAGAVPADPAHRAVVDKVTSICATRPPATEAGVNHYSLVATETGAQVLEFLSKFGCENINDVATVPEHWAGLIEGLNYVWPQ